MKLVHWSPLVLTLSGVLGCGSDPVTSSDPVDTDQEPSLGAPGGTTSGGTTSGGTGGTAGGTGGTAGSTGGTAGSIGGTQPMDGSCERVTTSAGPVQPDIMIVLDRSGSMRPEVDIDLDCSKTDLVTKLACGFAGIDCNNAPYMGTTVCGGSTSSGR